MPRYREDYTIFKRGRYWYYRVYDRNGHRTTAHSTGQTSKSAAKDWIRKHIACGLLAGDHFTYGAYAEHFFDPDSRYCLIHKIKPGTVSVYSSYNKNVLLPHFGKMALADITPVQLEKFILSIEPNYSMSATSIIVQTLHKVLVSAVKERLIADDPYKYLEWKSGTRKICRDSFTLEEVAMMCRECPEIAPAVKFLALTGLRIGEYLGYDETCLHDRYVHVSKIRLAGGRIQESTKTDEVRDVPLCPELVELAKEQRWSYGWYAKRFAKVIALCKDYKERNLSIHSLRHFFVSNTKASGVNPTFVEVAVGHSLKGMAQVYTHIKVDDMTEIMEWQKNTLDSLIDK